MLSARLAKDRKLVALAILLGAAAIASSLLVGPGSLADSDLRDTYVSLRSARLCAALLLGAASGVAGVLAQGLFRNPLADPGVIGTTAGAVLGGKLTLVIVEMVLGVRTLGGLAPDLLVPIGCMVGAAGALLCLLVVTRHSRSVLVVLLVGFSLSSLFGSLGGVLTSIAQQSWELGRALVAFALGSVAGVSMHHVFFALAPTLAGFVVAFRMAPALDVLLSGEDEARSVGVDVAFVRRWTAVWIAVLTGAAVSLGGFVAFVGLVVPHALRPYVGAEHLRLLPYAAVFGAIFAAFADVACRLVPIGGELPLGVVTGLVGAPIFLYMLVRSYRQAGLDV